MPATAQGQLSDVIAFSADGNSYFSPVTGQFIDWDTAQIIVDSQHQAGILIDGLDVNQQWGIPQYPTDAVEPTAQQNQTNLNAAAVQALAAAGLSGSNRGNWSQAQAVDYIRNFKGIISANPGMFTRATVDIANNINITADLSADSGRKLIDPNASVLFITDVLSGPVDMVTPIANIPTTVANAGQAAINAANSVVNAVNNAAKALDNSGGLAGWALPLAFIGFLWFATRSIGRDPGGQASKVISSF